MRFFLKFFGLLLISLFIFQCTTKEDCFTNVFGFTNESMFPVSLIYRQEDSTSFRTFNLGTTNGSRIPAIIFLNLDPNGNLESFIDNKPGFVNIEFNSNPKRCLRFPIITNSSSSISKVFSHFKRKMVALSSQLFGRKKFIVSSLCEILDIIIDDTLFNQATEEACIE